MNSSNDQNLSRDWSSRQLPHEKATESRRSHRDRMKGIGRLWSWTRFQGRRVREFALKLVYWRQSRLAFCSASRCIKGCLSDVNADRCYADQRRGLFIVADGKETEGEQASQTVIEVIAARLGARLDDAYPSLRDLTESTKRGVFQANQELMDSARGGGGAPTIEAAAVIGIVRHGRLLLCSVGNSRAYLWRANQLQQLTVDDTLVQQLVAAGSLTSREAAIHPMRHVLAHSIGTQKLEKPVQVKGHSLRDGDRLVFATDGLTHVIGENKLSALLAQCPDPRTAAKALTDQSRDAGAGDDVTCIVVDLFA
ncbi:MAG: PP2C family protein-serine/threonine phosphatase [Planctomycetota bacterium]